ncbi:MAG: [FeFe] hydrogenase, group A [Clostridiales bacterium]
MKKDNKTKNEKPALTRRQFLGVGLAAGTAVTLSGCGVVKDIGGSSGWVPEQYNTGGNWPPQVKGRVPLDPENISVVRDDKKCVLCGQCLEVCQNVQTVYGSYELPVLDEFICINCGQCALWCPSGAITERSQIQQVKAAIDDPDKVVVVQTAPSVRVGLGEAFGLPIGEWVEGQMVAGLRRLGFDVVFDTNFAADLTIMEEGTELINRLTKGGALPQFTSCCPGWVKFVEIYYPDLIPNLSTAKSPMSEQGPLIKTYYAKTKKINPKNIVSVAIMPCVGKKFEADRPELNAAGKTYNIPDMRDTDFVLSTRELADFMKMEGIDLTTLPEEKFDPLMGEGSGAGVIFGNTGGVMEAAVRTVYAVVSGTEPPDLLYDLQPVRGLEATKEAELNVPGFGPVRVAVCSSLSAARALCDKVVAGEANYHFIEVMTCPGGCISGGGQPKSTVPPDNRMRTPRTDSLYKRDATMAPEARTSHKNTEIAKIYANFLGEPCGHMSHKLLHTHYTDRSEYLIPKKGGEA